MSTIKFPAGINTHRKPSSFSMKRVNGVDIYTEQNPPNSEGLHALYRLNNLKGLSIECFANEEIEEKLKSLNYFHYKDAKALLDGKLNIKDYARDMGYSEEVDAMEAVKPEAKAAAPAKAEKPSVKPEAKAA